MSNVYDYPQYYEIAFSFRDIEAEVDVLEDCIRRFSKVPVKRVLELGCGNCPHTLALCGRGYSYIGIDLNPQMLEFSRRKTQPIRDKVQLMRADMNRFELDEPVDFVFIQVGSLFVTDDESIRSHFDSVANALRPGGLYFLDGCITFSEDLAGPDGITWELERDGIKVRTNVSWTAVNRARQLFNEKHTFDVDDNGKTVHVESTTLRRAIYPQEFLRIVDRHPAFEFVGWWHLWDLERPLDNIESPDRAIALIRRV